MVYRNQKIHTKKWTKKRLKWFIKFKNGKKFQNQNTNLMAYKIKKNKTIFKDL